MNEPSWVRDLRKKSLHMYENMESPSAKNELYKYIPLHSLREAFVLEKKEKGKKRVPCFLPPHKGIVLAEEEASLVLESRGGLRDFVASLPSGVLFCTLSEAFQEHGRLLRSYWELPSPFQEDIFAQEAYAKFQEGFFLYVKGNVKLKNKLRVTSLLENCFYRNMVVLEAGASLSLVEELATENENTLFNSGVTEFYLGEEASLEHIYLQGYSPNVNHLARKYMRLEKKAQLKYINLAWGGAQGQEYLKVDLLGEEASFSSTSAFRMEEEQHFGFMAEIKHHAPHSFSNLDTYSVVSDEAKATINASIQVQAKAIHSESKQRNKGLLLSQKSRIHSMPRLLIATDEVFCQHGSSISHIEPEALYYIESRGISRKEAVRMIVNSLLEIVLDEIPLEEYRHWASSCLDKKSWGEFT